MAKFDFRQVLSRFGVQEHQKIDNLFGFFSKMFKNTEMTHKLDIAYVGGWSLRSGFSFNLPFSDCFNWIFALVWFFSHNFGFNKRCQIEHNTDKICSRFLYKIDWTVNGGYSDQSQALELNIPFREDGLGRIQIATDEQIFTLVTPFSTELHKVMNRLIATA